MKNNDIERKKNLTYLVGQRIMRLRKSKKITQEMLTQKVDYRMNPNTVSVIERGLGDPKVSTIYAIAKALGVSMAELLDIDAVDSLKNATLEQQLAYTAKLLANMTDEEREKAIRILSVL